VTLAQVFLRLLSFSPVSMYTYPCIINPTQHEHFIYVATNSVVKQRDSVSPFYQLLYTSYLTIQTYYAYHLIYNSYTWSSHLCDEVSCTWTDATSIRSPPMINYSFICRGQAYYQTISSECTRVTSLYCQAVRPTLPIIQITVVRWCRCTKYVSTIQRVSQCSPWLHTFITRKPKDLP